MLNVRDVIEATGGEIVSEGGAYFSGVSIDSRTIREGELFIALKGDRFDGHDFMMDALKTGGGALVNRNAQCAINGVRAGGGLHITDYDTAKTIIFVDDTLDALHKLAMHMRKNFFGSVIGVIGSNGKTTTKELIASILSTGLNVVKTAGNLNNHIGMPLSIVRADTNTGVMVLEMGTNMPGDIDGLCSIALPDIGVITNIGYEHLEGFGSLEKVRDSELEILKYAKKLVLNADDSFLLEGVGEGFEGETFLFGIENSSADVTAKDIVCHEEGASFLICAENDCVQINSQLSGRFNVYNSLAAAAAALAAGFNVQQVKNGLEKFKGVNMRFEVRRAGGVTYLNDSYNANPSSMEESLKELARRIRPAAGGADRYKRAIAVLGDMLELGDYSVSAHKKLGQMMSELPIELFIGTGPFMALAVSEFSGKGIHTADSEEAGAELRARVREGDIVLVKGSRGMKMEKVLES